MPTYYATHKIFFQISIFLDASHRGVCVNWPTMLPFGHFDFSIARAVVMRKAVTFDGLKKPVLVFPRTRDPVPLLVIL